MNTLFIGAHADDCELACGGTIARYVAEGHSVSCAVLTDSGYTRNSDGYTRSVSDARTESNAALRVLGVPDANVYHLGLSTLELKFDGTLVTRIDGIIDRVQPDRIFTHWIGDVHQDHQAVSRATLAAGRRCRGILMYRSNWYHTNELFNEGFYIDISKYIDKKEEAIYCYQSEVEKSGKTWVEFFLQYNRLLGTTLGIAAAEAYEVVKLTE